MMTFRYREFLMLSGMALLLLISAACVSTTFGDVVYSGDGLALNLSHDGAPSVGYVQVTVYRIQNNQQEENGVFYAPLDLHPGENTLFIPARLGPGQYKLYLYLILDGERKAATIRDIVVI
jgi:hypothetical protein